MSQNKEEFKQEIKELISYIDEETTQIMNGEERDLSGLDDKVDHFCQKIEAAEADIAQDLEPLMADMISSLERLAGVLQEKA
jgi:hypothetical protein